MESAMVGDEHFVLGSIEKLQEDVSGFEVRADVTTDFSDAVTGGGFQVRGRVADHTRCIRIQTASSELIQAIQRSQRKALSWVPTFFSD